MNDQLNLFGKPADVLVLKVQHVKDNGRDTAGQQSIMAACKFCLDTGEVKVKGKLYRCQCGAGKESK